MKECTDCHITKRLDEFYLDKNGCYQIRCKECAKLKSRKYYQCHKKELYLTNKDWRKRNKEKSNSYYKKWRDNNKEQKRLIAKRYREKDPERFLEMKKRYVRENPHKVRASQHNSKAKRKILIGGSGRITGSIITELFSQQSNKCYYCKNDLAEYHIDHLIPLAKGGEHKEYNWVLACPKCNITKNKMMPDEFIRYRMAVC